MSKTRYPYRLGGEEVMKCEDINELLSAYLDEEVTPEERTLIESHLRTCEKCREELRFLASTQEQLRQALKAKSAEVEPSMQAWERVKQRISSKNYFGEKLSVMMTRPVWRVVIPIVTMLIVLVTLWRTGIIPGLIITEEASTSNITFIPGASGSASWATNYEDMGELCSLADLIVVGTVDRIIEVVPAEWGHGMIYDAKSAFRVETVLKGTTDKEIVLTHMALANPDGWLEGMAEDPPLQPRERWVFFLRVTESGNYNNFGPWGRYKVIDDKVYSMNQIPGKNIWYYEEKLDFNGVSLSNFIESINETLDSVVLTFTDSHGLPDRALRFDAGGYQTVNINLSTGTHGPDDLTYTIKRVESKDSAVEMPMPDELNVTIEPAKFTAYLRNKYQSTLKIQTTPDLPPGTYWICVEYQFGELTSGQRTLMVNINQSETTGTD